MFCGECGRCPPPPAVVALDAVAAGAYAPPLSTAIRRMKFAQRTDLADRLSSLLPRMPLSADVLVVPVPLHLARLVERGFNAPALMARRWCRAVGGQFAPWALERWRETPHQSKLSARERAHNVNGAFIAQRAVARRHALLLDDVITTGATLEECRAALRAAGAAHVRVVALAATPLGER
jgi:ComF family protein